MSGLGESFELRARDGAYELLNLMNHALEGVVLCEQFLDTSRRWGDSDVEAFIREVQATCRVWSGRAREMSERIRNRGAPRAPSDQV